MAGSQDDLAEKSLLSILGLTEVKSGRGGKYIPDGKISIGNLETFFELKHSPELKMSDGKEKKKTSLSTSRGFSPFKVLEHLKESQIWAFGQCSGLRLDRQNPDDDWIKLVFVPTRELMPLYVKTVLVPFYEGREASYLKSKNKAGDPAGSIRLTQSGKRCVGTIGWNRTCEITDFLLENEEAQKALGVTEDEVRRWKGATYKGISANDPSWAWAAIEELNDVLVLDPKEIDLATLRQDYMRWAEKILKEADSLDEWLDKWIEENPEYNIRDPFYDYEIEQDREMLKKKAKKKK